MSAVTGNAVAAAAAPSRRRGRSTASWIAVKLLGAVAVLWAAATVAFVLQTATQSGRAKHIIDQQTGTQQAPSKGAISAINHQFGFDHSVLQQYVSYIGGLAHGNLGVSFYQHEAVVKIIGAELWPTVELTLLSLLLAWALAITLTVLAAGRDNVWSSIANFLQMLGASLPTYWVGTILLVVFAVDLHVFPVIGGAAGLGLPTIPMALPVAGFLGQVINDEFSSVLKQPFVISSRSRGISDRGVRVKHVLRHAILPALTLSGWAVGYLFSNSVLVEEVFARPGIGSVLTTAANAGDVPVVTGVVLASAALYVVANLIVDALYVVVDPRLKGSR